MSVAHSISGAIHHMTVNYGTHVLDDNMILSPSVFFIFSKFWFSGFLGGGVKGQKMTQNEKKSLLCFISEEPYII